MIGILQFIHTTVWTTLFGKAADELQRSTESEDECEQIKKIVVPVIY